MHHYIMQGSQNIGDHFDRFVTNATLHNSRLCNLEQIGFPLMQFYIIHCCAIAHSHKSSSPCSTSWRRPYTTLHNLLTRLFTQLIASLTQFLRLVALALICIIHNFRLLPVVGTQLHITRRLVVTQHPVAQIHLHTVRYHAVSHNTPSRLYFFVQHSVALSNNTPTRLDSFQSYCSHLVCNFCNIIAFMLLLRQFTIIE